MMLEYKDVTGWHDVGGQLCAGLLGVETLQQRRVAEWLITEPIVDIEVDSDGVVIAMTTLAGEVFRRRR